MQRCTKSAAEKDLANFEVLMKIGVDGGVTKAFVSPPTKVALCLREDVLKGNFTPPPKPAYWVKVEMLITE
jgi:hypothetical protein